MHEAIFSTYTRIDIRNPGVREAFEKKFGTVNGTAMCIPHMWVYPHELSEGTEHYLRRNGWIFDETPPPFRRLYVPFDASLTHQARRDRGEQ